MEPGDDDEQEDAASLLSPGAYSQTKHWPMDEDDDEVLMTVAQNNTSTLRYGMGSDETYSPQ